MMQDVKVLGITGGVGAGKSTVLTYLDERYGACIIQADEVGRLLQTQGHSCYDKIVKVFGTGVIDSEGELRRDLLAEKVFENAEQLRKLNDIMHPAVKEYIVRRIVKERCDGKSPLIVVEAALLLEDGYDRICDEIWYIYADEETRISRLIGSRGYTRAHARDIMKNQMSESEYRKRCKFVIDNNEDIIENTYEQIDKGLMEHGLLQHCQR